MKLIIRLIFSRLAKLSPTAWLIVYLVTTAFFTVIGSVFGGEGCAQEFDFMASVQAGLLVWSVLNVTTIGFGMLLLYFLRLFIPDEKLKDNGI